MIPMFKFICTGKRKHKVRTLGTVASVDDPNALDGIELVRLGNSRFSIAANSYVSDENPSASRHPRTGAFTFKCPVATCGKDLRRSSATTADIINKLSALGVSSLDISDIRL